MQNAQADEVDPPLDLSSPDLVAPNLADVTPDEWDLLRDECHRELEQLRKEEVSLTLRMDSCQRKLRRVAQELEFLDLYWLDPPSFTPDDDYDAGHWLSGPLRCAPLRSQRSSPQCSPRPPPSLSEHWKPVLGTLTLRRSRLLLARARRLTEEDAAPPPPM